MSKIEIEDLQELLEKGYPAEYIQSLIQQILEYSLQVKQDYDNYKEWYLNTQVPGIYDHTRNIIIAHSNNNILGFVSLKKTPQEKKICTFYVEKTFRKNKIGTILVEKAINYLEEERPLITIPMNKLQEFTKIGEKYNWEITDIKENLYRTTYPEVIVNNELTKEIQKDSIQVEKSLKKTLNIYRIKQVKNVIKYFLQKEKNCQKL